MLRWGLAAALVVAAAPTAAAETVESCRGDEKARALGLDRDLRVVEDEGEFYLALDDRTIWNEDNGLPGLQRTATVCEVSERSGSLYLYQYSYVKALADSPFAAPTP